MPVRVNVNFSEQAYQTLRALSVHTGKSMSEVLRRAISMEAFFDQERRRGSRFLIEHPTGDIRELISVK